MATTLEIRDQAAGDAAWTLAEAWDEDYYPVDPIKIADRLGIHIHFGDLPEDVSGMLRCKDGKAEMWVDTDDSVRRQRFTVAHELGHFIKLVKSGEIHSPNERIDRRGDLARRGLDPDEIYANGFAASLLMPASVVRLLRARHLSTDQMARFFDVSPASMEYRLRNLGLPA
jgi:Zn-dependent peptidase ImmA (M78 family)